MALILFSAGSGFAQNYLPGRGGDVFLRDRYPNDSFSVREKEFVLGDSRIVLTALMYDYLEPDTAIRPFQLWITQKNGERILRSKFLGALEGENGWYLPMEQPLPDFFLIEIAGEFTGIFYLISPRGVWYEIPGAELLLDAANQILYTYVPVECGGCPIARFSVRSRKMFTRQSDGSAGAWAEVKDKTKLNNVYEKGIWIDPGFINRTFVVKN